LSDWVFSKPDAYLAPGWRAHDPVRIANLYRSEGFRDVEAEMRILDRPDGRADVVFAVEEGARFTVGSVTFPGATVDRCILADRLLTRAEGSLPRLPDDVGQDIRGGVAVFSKLVQALGLGPAVFDHPFRADSLEIDAEILRRHYLGVGRVDVRIGAPEITERGTTLDIAFPIYEGPVYHLGKVEVVEAGRRNTALTDALTLRSGDVFNNVAVEETIAALEETLVAEGRTFVRVEPTIERDDAARTLSITFRIVPDEELWIRAISFSGLEETLEQTVRERLPFADGDPFRLQKTTVAYDRLMATGWFESVGSFALPADDDTGVLVHFTVTEQPTADFSVGAGYNLSSGPFVEAMFGETNLWGRGLGVELGFNVSALGGWLVARLTDPWPEEANWGLSFTTGEPSDPLMPLFGFQIVVWLGWLTLRIPALLLIVGSGIYYCHLWREDGSRVRRQYGRMMRRLRALVILQSTLFCTAMFGLVLRYAMTPIGENAAAIACG
ncbi:MAG: POTRA domain-containing protein, partial [Pseudomonadota bacterium]